MKHLYENIPDNLKEACGWFDSKVKPKKIDDKLFITKELFDISLVDMNADNSIVAYFPGSFGNFHEGHLDIVQRIYNDCKKITENFVIVISPANSDYTLEKYGETTFATNEYRYNQILSYKNELSKMNVVIDLDPMLNYTCDQVFTIFGQQFMEYKKWNSRIVYIGGKDRDYSRLNDFGVNFWFYPEEKEFSTSKNFAPRVHENKKLFIRCYNEKESKLFEEYFGQYYQAIFTVIIEDEEIKQLKEYLKRIRNKKVATICKDYKDVLPYIPFSRNYDTPLDKPYHNEFDRQDYDIIIDSDVFSGGTKRTIEDSGANFHAIHEFNPNDMECIDIDDFRNEKYVYPYVDVSSRCSLPAFDLDMHNKMKEFIEKLKEI